MIDFKKFEKYSRPGPRYTSYPTALEFHENFSTDDLVAKLKNTDSTTPISLYVHLPFCRSACYFCGCNVLFTSKQEKKTRYLGYLKKELKLIANHIDTSRRVTQLHFGGGTPTFFSPSELGEVYDAIYEIFVNFDATAEISCEVDPRFFSVEHMEVMKKANLNRLSFGVQDLDEKVQKTVHRIQPFETTQNVVNIARDAGINSINIDLIYGLPHQTASSFATTLQQIIKLNPDRLAVFNYAHVPWLMKTQRKFDETTFAPPSTKLVILQDTIKFFETAGYRMVGMDHFAKPDDELFKAIDKGELHRNFQGYTTKGGAQLVGVGVTSIGDGDDYFVQNHKNLADYEKAIDSGVLPVFKGYQLNEDDKIRKYVIMELMSNFSLDKKAVEQKFDIKFDTYFSQAVKHLQEFVEAGLVSVDDSQIKTTATGSMLIRNIAMCFDIYFWDKAPDKQRFSKTI